MIGAIVGFCSSITGTAGPFILLPLLLALGVSVIVAVAAAQVIQIPLVIFAVVGYATQGSVDFGVGAVIGAIAAVGAFFGARAAISMPRGALTVIAGVVLTALGVLMAVTSIHMLQR